LLCSEIQFGFPSVKSLMAYFTIWKLNIFWFGFPVVQEFRCPVFGWLLYSEINDGKGTVRNTFKRWLPYINVRILAVGKYKTWVSSDL
jgi:hypothetical protein